MSEQINKSGKISAADKAREKSPDEIRKSIRELREELLNLRVRKKIGQVENPARLRLLRRDIARHETILREKARATASAS